jgi:excisionase family DNA binding protein
MMSDERRERTSGELTVVLPPEALETIAQRAAEITTENLRTIANALLASRRQSEYLTVSEAADLLRANRQRVYDLVSSRRLERYKDGSRVLVKRAEIEAYLAREGPRPVASALPGSARSRAGSGVRR